MSPHGHRNEQNAMPLVKYSWSPLCNKFLSYTKIQISSTCLTSVGLTLDPVVRLNFGCLLFARPNLSTAISSNI